MIVSHAQLETEAETAAERVLEEIDANQDADDGAELCGNQIYGAFVLNRRVDLHAIDATPARRRGDNFHTGDDDGEEQGALESAVAAGVVARRRGGGGPRGTRYDESRTID